MLEYVLEALAPVGTLAHEQTYYLGVPRRYQYEAAYDLRDGGRRVLLACR
jgi:hypothetical protein